jgi:hypothetical protein
MLWQQRSEEAQGGPLNLAAELGMVAHVATGFAVMRDARESFPWRLASRFLKATETEQCIALDSLHGGPRDHCMMLGR